MISANKRLLKATLTEGVLHIQYRLIELYSNNLNTLATQFSIIAAFTMEALIFEGYPEEIPKGKIVLLQVLTSFTNIN